MITIRRWLAPSFLIAVGILQMAGDVAGIPVIKAMGAATAASPAPKVFTAHKGFETYSSYFYLSWRDREGNAHRLLLTPRLYRGVRGPYNRRNAYGAALSYAPVLISNKATKPMLDSVLRFTFCGASTILEEMGVDRGSIASPVTVELAPRQTLQADHPWQLSYVVNCHGQ